MLNHMSLKIESQNDETKNGCQHNSKVMITSHYSDLTENLKYSLDTIVYRLYNFNNYLFKTLR